MRIGALFLFFISCTLSAKQSADVFSMSLEELLNIEIITASQNKESKASSLAIVSVLTSKHLKQLGVLNLYEALSFVPGVVINESYVGFSVLTFRGVTPGLYNNKALFLINGHAVNENLFGSSHLEFIPIDMVERIEVVRSPSSVLYGSNAISGVVNVITKQEDSRSDSIKLSAGSFSYLSSSFTLFTDNINISASIKKDNGYLFSGTLDELGQAVSKNYRNDLTNLFVDFHLDSWRVNTAFYRSKKEKLGLNPIIQHGGLNDYEAFYVDINRQFKLKEGSLSAWLRYDSMDRTFQTQNFPDPVNGASLNVDNRLSRYSAEVNFKDRAFETLDYIVGIHYQHDKAGPFLFVDNENGMVHPFSPIQDPKHYQNIAFYSQGQFNFNQSVVGLVGFRFEDNSDTGTGFNPRIGLNTQIAEDSHLKILYSESYRSPVFLEKYANVPGILLGDMSLKRERIHTTELALDTRLSNSSSLQATLFNLHLLDEITRRPGVVSGTEYFNSDGRKMYGVEFEYHSILSDSTELRLNASYVDGKLLPEGDPYVANYTVNAILTHQFDESWAVSFSSQGISAKKYTTTSGDEGELSAYSLSNIVVSYISDDFELNITAKNIFDEKYTFPEPVRANIKEIPGGAGAAVYLSLSFSL